MNDLISRQTAIEALKGMAVPLYKDPACEDIWERDRTLDNAIDASKKASKKNIVILVSKESDKVIFNDSSSKEDGFYNIQKIEAKDCYTNIMESKRFKFFENKIINLLK